jgi:hypothetical protein
MSCEPALKCAASGRFHFTLVILHTVEYFILYRAVAFASVHTKHKQPFLLYIVNTNLSLTVTKIFKTFNNGSLGSRIDEERSEMRYVM